MRCKRCNEKALARREIMIKCKKCGKEAAVNYFNNNICGDCNEKAKTCSECGRSLES